MSSFEHVLRQGRRALTVVGLSLLIACGGGGGSGDASTDEPGSGGGGTPPVTDPDPPVPDPDPPADPPVVNTMHEHETEEEAARFIAQAGFGEDLADLNALTGTSASEWVEQQLNMPGSRYLPGLLQREQDGLNVRGRRYSDTFFDEMITGEDVLRKRMVFALSQLIVVSDLDMSDRPLGMAYYIDKLNEHAFGNYRDLLQDITYTPVMADYLTYLRNLPADPITGRMPDENYAREILQLFTVGLVELNMDGTPRLGAGGQPIEIYDNRDIEGLARVFTGLTLKSDGIFSSQDEDAWYSPLRMFDPRHSEEAKSFLGMTIPAGTLGNDSVTKALDHIFDHPNVAPFIARQLIQRFTSSSPSPDYVERVAEAFETGVFEAADGRSFGSTGRGDLAATIAAILLDPSIHGDVGEVPTSHGKIREPILRFVHWARAFRLANVDTSKEGTLDNLASLDQRLGQHQFRSPSVFNFYRPGFIAPGTQSGEAGLTAPELQLGFGLGYVNLMTSFVFDQTRLGDDATDPNFTPNYTDEFALADDPAALVAHLNLILTANQMSEDEVPLVEDIVASIEISSNPNGAPQDRERRAMMAILTITQLAAYGVVQ